jgi:Ankyrin repeats (many copies)
MAEQGKAVAPSCLREEDMEAIAAAKSGNPDALRCASDQKEHGSWHNWDHLMDMAIGSGSLDCVKVLYDKGNEQHRPEAYHWHPAIIAIEHGHLEILRFVVDRSGPPEEDLLYCDGVVRGGVEMLQYVQQLGCVFDEEATMHAAYFGSLEALRYLHVSGVPWHSETLVAALRGNSLPCLEYAHMHGYLQEEDWDYWADQTGFGPSLPLLQYACEQMDPALLLEC